MKKPTFDKLDEIFEHITSLRLTDREYADKTGASLPKRKSYLVNESAFSRWLNGKGFKIVDVQEDELTDSEVEAIVVKKLYKQIQYQWPTADAGSCRYSLNKIERTSHYITAYGEVYLYDKYGKLMSGSYSHTFKILCTADGETVYSCRFDD